MSSSEYYIIVSQLHGMVLDVDNGGTSPGTNVFPFPKHGANNQLWIDDPATGTIRTKLNDYCLDIKDGVLVINPYSPGIQSQQWKRMCHVIVNSTNCTSVLDIKEGDKTQRAPVVSFQYHGAPNQKWDFELSGVKKS